MSEEEAPLFRRNEKKQISLKEYDIKEILTSKTQITNLFILNLAWASTSFGYTLIGCYIKYIPGDIYYNVLLSSISETIACFSTGLLCNYFGIKRIFIQSFFITCISALALVFFNSPDYPHTIMILVLLIKYGMSSANTLCYLTTVEYFPAIYASSIFGECNTINRFA